MRRRFLIGLLILGTIGGFTLGFASMRRHCGRHGGYFGHHSQFEQRVSDACAEAALRVYRGQSAPAAPGR